MTLYVNPVPVGVEIVIVPVATAQEGCVTLIEGATGVTGAALIEAVVGVEIHPAVFWKFGDE